MMLDQDRAREFETVMLQAAGFLAATARPPLMKDFGIKAMIKELADTSGSKAQPMTIGTTRMLTAALHEVIPRLWVDQPLIEARESVNLINEAISALRVGESCNGGGEGYGLDANNTMIVTNIQAGEVTMEIYLKCSKTHLGRWVEHARCDARLRRPAG